MMMSTKTKFKYDPAIYHKTANIFGKIIGAQINLKFEEKGTCKIVQNPNNPKKLTIHLNPNNAYVTGEEVFYSCEEHELAHPLFKSDAMAIVKFGEGMQERYGQYGIRARMAENLARILDDQRIESCWAEIYPGSLRYFRKLRKGVITRPASDLAQMLLAARANKPELIHPFFLPFYQYLISQLEKVERKSIKAVFVIGHQIIKDYIEIIKQFLSMTKDKDKDQDAQDSQCDMPLPIPPQQKESSSEDGQETSDKVKEGDRDSNNKDSESNDFDDVEEDNEETDDVSESSESNSDQSSSVDTDKDEGQDKPTPEDTEIDSDESSHENNNEDKSSSGDIDSDDELDDIFEDFDFSDLDGVLDDDIKDEDIAMEIKRRYLENPGTYEEETKLVLNLPIDMKQVLEDIIEDVLEEAMEEFEKDLQSIEKKLSEFQAPDPTVNTQMPIKTEECFSFDNRPVDPFPEVTQLKQIFRRINTLGSQSSELGLMGELDIDEYIQFMLGNADPEFFIEEKEVNKLNMVLLIDGSGSMCGSRLKKAKRLALTCKKAAESIGQVNVDVWIFSGSYEFTPVQKLTEMELRTVRGYGATHTNDAVRFVTQQPDYRYQKNVLFLITDGMPQGACDKYREVVKTYNNDRITFVQADTHYALNEARQKGWKIFTFFIDDPEGNSAIFGNPFVCMTTDRLTDILGYFEREVKIFLSRR